MAVGDGAKFGYTSLLGVSPEVTYGTAVTATSFIAFNSESMKVSKEQLLLDSINTTRNYQKRMFGNTTVDGSIEADLDVGSDAVVNIIKQALGGTCASATMGAGQPAVFIHTIWEGNMENNVFSATGGTNTTGLTIQVRKGGVVAAAGTITSDLYTFNGCRVNSLSIKGELGQPIRFTAELIGKDCTVSTDSLTASFSTLLPLHFTGVTFSLGDTIGNLAAESIQGFEFNLSNNLVGDNAARKLGSETIQILPPTRREVKLSITQRWDTATAFTRYQSGTTAALKIVMTSTQTISAAAGATTYSMAINLPKCYRNTGLPEVGDFGVLSQDIEYTAIHDSEQGYCAQAVICNATTDYN